MRKNKTKTNSLFFEHKFVWAKRKDEELFADGTPVEKGNLEAESVITEFQERYNPWNLDAAINNPDEVVFGVRDRMVDPLGGFAGLTSDTILNNRVYYKLQHVAVMAPRAYQQIIDEEIRRRGGPPANSSEWSNARRDFERQVARDLFSYNIRAGANYMTLITALQAQIMALGLIGGGTFLDSRGQNINLANPAQTNEFDVAVGAPGVPAQETVVIRWNQEDYISIKNKLERAGRWAEFSNQGNAREFIHLKFRCSLLRQVVLEEAAKLSNDKYNSQRLITWLENDLTDQAFREDIIFRTWVTRTFLRACARRVPPVTTAEQLQLPANRDLLRDLRDAQNEARERIRPNSLYNRLNKILVPKSLENVKESKETKTLLAYLFHKNRDPDDVAYVNEYIHQLSGIDYTSLMGTCDLIRNGINAFIPAYNSRVIHITENQRRIGDLTARIGRPSTPGVVPPDGTGIYIQIENTQNNINALSVAGADTRGLPALTERLKQLEDRREAMENQIRELRNNNTTEQNGILEEIQKFQTVLRPHAENRELWGNLLNNILNPGQRRLINTIIRFDPRTLRNKAAIRTFLSTFGRDYSAHNDAFTKMSDVLKTQKGNFERRQKKYGTPEKMDSRGLLYLLVKRDLERKGVTAETGLNEKAHLTTNLLIADCRNAEIYGHTNQKIAAGLEKSLYQNVKEAIQSMSFFSPTLSGKDAVEHIVDTNPDLGMFRDINLLSTRKDLILMMQRYGMAQPAKIREFVASIGECIRGIEGVPEGRAAQAIVQKFRVIDEDVPHLERIINMLTLLESQMRSEDFLKRVREAEAGDPSLNRERLILNMLMEETEGEVALDERIANSLQGQDARFKRLLEKTELRRELNQARTETEGMTPEMQEEELRKRGLSSRLDRRGIVSLRTERGLLKATGEILKYNPITLLVAPSYWESTSPSEERGFFTKAGTYFLKYNPANLIAYGLGSAVRGTGRFTRDYIKAKWTGVVKPELDAGHAVWKNKTEGAVTRSVLFVVGIPVAILAWAADKIRPKKISERGGPTKKN